MVTCCLITHKAASEAAKRLQDLESGAPQSPWVQRQTTVSLMEQRRHTTA